MLCSLFGFPSVCLTCFQIYIIRLDVVGEAAGNDIPVTGRELEFQRRDDRVRELVLEIEDVAEVAIVALSPEMKAGRSIDQLGIDPDAFSCSSGAAFQHVSDTQVFG